MQQRRRDNAYKTFVTVVAIWGADGTIKPVKFKADGFPAVTIDKVTDVRTAASLRSGGQGERFTCRIGEREIYLFLDGSYWFVDNDELVQTMIDSVQG